MDIIFTNTSDYDGLSFPKPASAHLPEWYKNTKSYMGDIKKPTDNGSTTATIKKCFPIFDALTSGYILETPADVWVSIRDGNQHFQWSGMNLIGFHPIEQAHLHPNSNGYPYPKWNNPWSIKTPKGYSSLFVQPFHRESVFTIFPGIVDTDIYTAPVNFPFVINNLSFEGLIPAGTPIVQIIPIKRDPWIAKPGTLKHKMQQENITKRLHLLFFNRYKTLFWQKKEYK